MTLHKHFSNNDINEVNLFMDKLATDCTIRDIRSLQCNGYIKVSWFKP